MKLHWERSAINGASPSSFKILTLVKFHIASGRGNIKQLKHYMHCLVSLQQQISRMFDARKHGRGFVGAVSLLL